MASGSNAVTGAFVATGAALNIDTVGFSPRRVELVKVSGTVGSLIWTDTMAADAGFKQVGGTTSFVTSGGITPRDEGFAFGADALNVAGTVFHYTAWR